LIPFPAQWPQLETHRNHDCSRWNDPGYYFNLSNTPSMPPESDIRGGIVVIAGKPRTGGKSVLSHRLLHSLVENNFYIIDLMAYDSPNKALDHGLTWFKKAVSKANLENLLTDKAVSTILSMEDNDWYPLNERLRRELAGSAVAIRMPKLDKSLKAWVVARDIGYFAKSAQFLEHSVYLYEYSYVDDRDWQDLQQSLDDLKLDNVTKIEVPLLLVEDAVAFIDSRLEEHPRKRDAIDWEETQKYLQEEAVPGTDGLEQNIGDLNWVMHRAFEQSEKFRYDQVPARFIVKFYSESVSFRTLARRFAEGSNE
jgi:hypothetical protein